MLSNWQWVEQQNLQKCGCGKGVQDLAQCLDWWLLERVGSQGRPIGGAVLAPPLGVLARPALSSLFF